MKRKYSYQAGDKVVEREYNYIPVRYIIAILITVFEVAAIIGIVIALCYYVPYFYILAWLTEIACVVKIIASDDNPDYKIPWLLFVLILPIAGFMPYFLFYNRTLQKRFIRRLQMLKDRGYKKGMHKRLSIWNISSSRKGGSGIPSSSSTVGSAMTWFRRRILWFIFTKTKSVSPKSKRTRSVWKNIILT